MARAETITLFGLDEYAKIMGISPCAFNQVIDPNYEPSAHACDETWLQDNWIGGNRNRYIGREDVARAIASAEEQIANQLGFFVAPKWTADEQQQWPVQARGCRGAMPPILTRWGWVIEGGQENTETVISAYKPVVYTGSGCNSVGTITVTAAELAAVGASITQVAVYPPSEYLDFPLHQISERWRIRMERIRYNDAGDVVMQANKCRFVVPELWETDNELRLDIGTNFLDAVEIRRRYNNTEDMAQIAWTSMAGSVCTTDPACVPTCQDACISLLDRRRGKVQVFPATYSSGTYAMSTFSDCSTPSYTRLWYQSGYWQNIAGWMEQDFMRQDLARAIVKLANTYMHVQPCGCDWTRQAFESDREVLPIDSMFVAEAVSKFGSSMRGAVEAWQIIKGLDPLRRGSSL